MDSVRWLSYEEAADVLGIALDSARVTARRKRWPRRMGNDRKARIGVPESLIAARRVCTRALSGDSTESSPRSSPESCSGDGSANRPGTVAPAVPEQPPAHASEL